MLHNLARVRRSVRFLTGGGSLVRSGIRESGGPGWSCTINLPLQRRVLCELSYRAIEEWFLRPALPWYGPLYEKGAFLPLPRRIWKVALPQGLAP